MHIPEIFPFIFSCYLAPSLLLTWILSAEGVQQGVTLWVLYYCLVIHPLVLRLKSEFKVFYLDDGTIGGSEENVLHHFQLMKCEASDLGLQLNQRKSELICNDSVGGNLLCIAPALCRIDSSAATLLGAPIGDLSSIDSVIAEKVTFLRIMRSRLNLLHNHDAILLRSTLSDVLNISFEMESTWLQVSLPVKFGGIRVRSVVMLAPSAFLASAAGTSSLINCILPVAFHSLPYAEVSDALTAWQKGQDYPPPPSPSAINSIVQRSLAAAQIPSTIEPNGLFRSDGKRPDDHTIAPWRMGRSLVWDATCPDTYAVSYIAHATRQARAVAGIAEKKKKRAVSRPISDSLFCTCGY